MPIQVTPWDQSVQSQLIQALDLKGGCHSKRIPAQIQARADVGYQTYGTYLGVGNPGRDGDRDLQDELLDGMVYAYERYLATHNARYWAAVLRLAYTLEDLYGLDDR